MGLIYASSDSTQLINALKANLQSGREASERLKIGSQQLISAVDGQTLSGEAYNAAKGLFSDLVVPTITRMVSAIDSLEAELETYSSADSDVSDEGILDEDKLNLQITTKKAMKASCEAAASTARELAKVSVVDTITDSLLNTQKNLTNMANNLEDDIIELEEKLEKLHQFSSQVSGLFSNSLADMQISMQSIMVLNNTTVNSDGSYKLPEGTDASWFKEKKNKDLLENSIISTVKNMPKNMSAEETEKWILDNLERYGSDFLDYLKDGSDISESILNFKSGKAFLNGIPVTQDSLGRLRWGDRFLNKPSSNGSYTYNWGKKFKEKSGIDLADYHYSRLPSGGVNLKELGAAGGAGFKEAINPINDFKGWKDASKLGKFGKVLGALGTGVTVAENFSDNIDLSDGLGVGETVNFVTDTAIDLGAGASAAAIGGMVGSAFLPPLGTVVGAGAGMIASTLINWEWGNPPKSFVDHTKEGVKTVTKGIGDWFNNTILKK